MRRTGRKNERGGGRINKTRRTAKRRQRNVRMRRTVKYNEKRGGKGADKTRMRTGKGGNEEYNWKNGAEE